jgi:hypothetical protein
VLVKHLFDLQNKGPLPIEGAASLVLGDAGLKEVLLFVKVGNFAHPREGVR